MENAVLVHRSIFDGLTGGRMSRSAHLSVPSGPARTRARIDVGPGGQHALLAGERHLGKLVPREPAQLGDIVGGDRLTRRR